MPAKLQLAIDGTDLLTYGEVLRAVLTHSAMFFVRGDTVVECWRIIEPGVEGWATNDVPIQEYPAGSNGPEGWKTSREDTAL
ncbi:hypothetical protein IV500_09055 [Paeniglutamicibacter antarcticus]|uniref:Glucose-6-phosphate dehydrogenase C-terminal domain-containing protein n=1 Tax=Arthrobacter terrae TaxID=2935737 RepID=A0A931CR95_9MICC|nr:hypothetical protein [Arthrobacter terrae]MBG0739531.1 hypothetical protein [Arthrobacter terrae]